MLRERREKLLDEVAKLKTDEDYTAFGRKCAKQYIPDLVAALDRHEPVEKAASFEDLRTCTECYWNHQTIKYGCADCTGQSQFIGLFSPDAKAKHKEYLDRI